MNFPLDRTRGALIGAALLVVLALVAFAVVSRSAEWTLVFAGGLLLAAGFVVMAPCQLQMSAMLTVVLRNLAAREAEASGSFAPVRRSAALFALGYVLFYLPVAVALGGAAWVLGRYAWVLAIAGGLMAIVLGLAALGALREGWLARCRGPLYLVRSGRASFQKPFKAGIAFGQYCATCCGPYLYALVVLAGATGSFYLGSGLVMVYAATMVVPFLLPVLLAPGAYTAVMDLAQVHGARLERATGLVLVGVGVLLMPVAILTALG